MSRSAILVLLLLACALGAKHLQAQVRRCTTTDGTLVYTDRKCEDIGATERIADPVTAGRQGIYRRPTCARNVQDLGYSLSTAIYSGDVNQVAGLYDWTGMSTRTGYQLMERLGVITDRTLVDVQPMYSGGTNEYGYDIVQFDPETGEVVSKPPSKPRLIGLRVEQVLKDGHTPSRTVFGVRKRLGCWWIRL